MQSLYQLLVYLATLFFAFGEPLSSLQQAGGYSAVIEINSLRLVMDFWNRLDKLIESHEIVIDRPRGSFHPEYPSIKYPFDYGYLKGTSAVDGNEMDVCRGTLGENRLAGLICTVDSLKNDAEVKLLIDCSEADIAIIDKFFNTGEYMSGIIIKRSKE
jgi:inorganic pyrophosphatase